MDSWTDGRTGAWKQQQHPEEDRAVAMDGDGLRHAADTIIARLKDATETTSGSLCGAYADARQAIINLAREYAAGNMAAYLGNREKMQEYSAHDHGDPARRRPRR